MDENKKRALSAALGQIEKQFGKGSVMRLGEEGRAPVAVIPTGSIALDVALGVAILVALNGRALALDLRDQGDRVIKALLLNGDLSGGCHQVHIAGVLRAPAAWPIPAQAAPVTHRRV